MATSREDLRLSGDKFRVTEKNTPVKGVPSNVSNLTISNSIISIINEIQGADFVEYDYSQQEVFQSESGGVNIQCNIAVGAEIYKFDSILQKATEAFADNPVKALTISTNAGAIPNLNGDTSLSDRLPSNFTLEFITTLPSNLNSFETIVERNNNIKLQVSDIKPAIDKIISAGFPHNNNILYHILLSRDGSGDTFVRVNGLYTHTIVAKELEDIGEFRFLPSANFKFSMISAYSTETITALQAAYNAIAVGSVIDELHEFCVLELHGDNDGLEKVESGDNFENLGFTVNDILLIDTAKQYNDAKTTALSNPTHARLINATANDYVFGEATPNQAGSKILDFYTGLDLNNNFTNPNDGSVGSYLDVSNNEISSGLSRIVNYLPMGVNVRTITFDPSFISSLSSYTILYLAFFDKNQISGSGGGAVAWSFTTQNGFGNNRTGFARDLRFTDQLRADAGTVFHNYKENAELPQLLKYEFNGVNTKFSINLESSTTSVGFADFDNGNLLTIGGGSPFNKNSFMISFCVIDGLINDDDTLYLVNNSMLNNNLKTFPSCKLLYKADFDNVSGTTIFDLSNNNRDGVISNSPSSIDFKLIKSSR